MRRKMNLVKLMHTYLSHNLNHIEFPWVDGNDSVINSQVRMTRQASAPFLPLKIPRTTLYRNSCAYMGPKLWLDLPLNFRLEADPIRFKRDMKVKARADLENIISVFE